MINITEKIEIQFKIVFNNISVQQHSQFDFRLNDQLWGKLYWQLRIKLSRRFRTRLLNLLKNG